MFFDGIFVGVVSKRFVFTTMNILTLWINDVVVTKPNINNNYNIPIDFWQYEYVYRAYFCYNQNFQSYTQLKHVPGRNSRNLYK